MCQYVQGQYRENTFKPDDLSTKTFNLKPKEEFPIPKLPFKVVKVIDARFDSSKLGFVDNSSPFLGTRENFQKLKLRNGIARNLENYYSHSIGNQDSNQLGLLIVLKKFWVTSTRTYDYQKQSLSYVIGGESRVIVKWEYYLFKDDQYLPFQRLDTSIESLQSVTQLFKDENAGLYNKESIYSLLNHFIGKFDYSKAIAVFNSRPKKTLIEIESANRARFSLPVLSDSTINSGVFYVFDEFIKNKPALTEFHEKTVKYSLSRTEDFLTDGNDNRILNYWGYAQKKYIRVGPYGNETIFRIGNSFEFFVKRRIASPGGNGGNGFTNHYYLW
ncbi:MAG: hypothetical protein EOO13_08525, partial [Chitinophagaceae bacterium]